MMKLKILLLTIYNYPHPGGISSHINTLRNGLEKLNTDVDIYSANSLSKFLYYFLKLIYSFRRLNKTIFFSFYMHFLKLIFEISLFVKFLKQKWNLINAQDPIALNCTKLIRIFYRPKILLSLHGFLSAETLVDLGSKNTVIFNLLMKEEKEAYEEADKIITIEKSREKHILKFNINPKKVIVLKNFVNISIFKKIKANYFINKFCLNKKVKLILFPRRIVKESGIEYFIESAKKILKNTKDYYFIILGKGNLSKKIKKLVRNQPNIIFHNPVPNNRMPYIYNSVDIVVIPSISIGSAKEGSSMSILESLACGVPVIATSVGGNVEIIESGKTGILIPEKNSDELSKAILDLCENRDLRNEISKNSRNFVKRNFSHIKYAKKFMNFYLSS